MNAGEKNSGRKHDLKTGACGPIRLDKLVRQRKGFEGVLVASFTLVLIKEIHMTSLQKSLYDDILSSCPVNTS